MSFQLLYLPVMSVDEPHISWIVTYCFINNERKTMFVNSGFIWGKIQKLQVAMRGFSNSEEWPDSARVHPVGTQGFSLSSPASRCHSLNTFWKEI